MTPIPYLKKRRYPRMAYVEFVDNDLPLIPRLPEVIDGTFVTFPRIMNDVETEINTS